MNSEDTIHDLAEADARAACEDGFWIAYFHDGLEPIHESDRGDPRTFTLRAEVSTRLLKSVEERLGRVLSGPERQLYIAYYRIRLLDGLHECAHCGKPVLNEPGIGGSVLCNECDALGEIEF